MNTTSSIQDQRFHCFGFVGFWLKSSAFLSKPAVVQEQGRRRWLLWYGEVGMDSLVLKRSRQTELRVICPQLDFFF